MNTIHTRLKAAREKAELSQEDVAKVLKVSRQSVSGWEREKTKGGSEPRRKKLEALAKLYDCPVEFLQFGSSQIQQKLNKNQTNIELEQDNIIILPLYKIDRANGNSMLDGTKDYGGLLRLDAAAFKLTSNIDFHDGLRGAIVGEAGFYEYSPGSVIIIDTEIPKDLSLLRDDIYAIQMRGRENFSLRKIQVLPDNMIKILPQIEGGEPIICSEDNSPVALIGIRVGAWCSE